MLGCHWKEVSQMKIGKKVVTKLAKATAEKALRRDANHTACFGLYQPKIPNSMERFRKSKHDH